MMASLRASGYKAGARPPTSHKFVNSLFAVILIASSASLALGQERKIVPKPLLIVAPKALEPALADYVKFKKTQLSTRLVPLETILRSSSDMFTTIAKRIISATCCWWAIAIRCRSAT